MSEVELQLSVETKKALDSVQSFTTGSISAFKNFAAAAVAYLGSRAIVGSIESFISAAQESEDAINALNISLASSGTYSEDASKSLQAFAKSMQDTTGVSDELILNQIAIARNFTKTNEEAKKLTQAAIQLSAATGKDLDSSIQALGKSVQGVGGSLEKTIPSVKAFSEEQLKAGAAVDFILQRFGGVAESKLLSFSGVVLGAKNAFGDLLEVLGDVIIKNPVLIALIDQARKSLIYLAGTVEKNKDALNDLATDGFKKTSTAITISMRTVEYATKLFGLLISQTLSVADAILLLVEAFAELEVVRRAVNAVNQVIYGLAIGITSLVSGFIDIANSSSVMRQTFKNLGLDVDSLKESVDRFGVAFKENLGEDTSGDFIVSINEARESLNNFRVETEKSLGVASETISGLGDISEETSNKIEKMGSTQEDASLKAIEALNKNAQSLKGVAINVEELKKKAEDAFKNPYNFIVNSVFESHSKINSKFKNMVESVQNYVNNNPVIIQTVAATTGLMKSLFTSGALSPKQLEKELTDAILGAESQLNVAISEINKQRDEALVQIEGDFNSSIEDIQKQLIEGAITQVEYQQKVNDLEKKRVKNIELENKKATEKIQEERISFEKNVAKIREENAKKVTELQEKNVQAAAKVAGEFANAVGAAMGLPPIFGDIINMLSAPPEVWEGIIDGLVQGMPIVIQRLVENIPTIISALADAMPEIVVKLTDSLLNLLTDPQFWVKILSSSVKVMIALFEAPFKGLMNIGDKINQAMFDFIKNILAASAEFGKYIYQGAVDFVGKLVRELENGLKKIFSGGLSEVGKGIGKGGSGSFLDTAIGSARTVLDPGGIFGFATGGTIPSGFPNDTFPAKLTSGEMVIPTSDVQRLSSFLDKEENQTDNTNLLNQIKSILNQSNGQKNLTINLTVGEKELASVMLDLNRRGFRTA